MSQTVFGFTGEPTDANGLVHLRARYYNPVLSLFTGLDPLEGNAGQPMSLNRYLYVRGNPINAIDPSGMFDAKPGCSKCYQSKPSSPCSVFIGDAVNYDECLYNGGLNRCPSGWTETRDFWGTYCRNDSTGETMNPAAAWDIIWRTAQQNRETWIKNQRDMLLGDSTLNGRERLVTLINRVVCQFDYEEARPLSDDISLAVVGARGIFTLGTRSTVPPLGVGGFNKGYNDGTNNQAFHFWAYCNSVAQGGLLGQFEGIVVDYLHECQAFVIDAQGVPQFHADIAGASVEDARLAYSGMAVGNLIHSYGITPCQLGPFVDAILQAPYPGSVGDPAPWYYKNMDQGIKGKVCPDAKRISMLPTASSTC